MNRTLLFLLFVLFANLSFGENTDFENRNITNRMQHRLGFFVGILNEPATSVFATNLAINLTDYLRLSGGLGTDLVDGFKIGCGIRFLLPGMNFTPTLQASISHHLGTNSGYSFGIGGEWINSYGLYLGFGINYAALGYWEKRPIRLPVPYFNFGLFFS